MTRRRKVNIVDTAADNRTGDAVPLADPGDLGAGLVFRGRIAEDFKLETGTFVRVGALRTALGAKSGSAARVYAEPAPPGVVVAGAISAISADE